MYSINEVLSFKLLTIVKQLNEPFKKELQSTGITPANYATMLVIYEHPGITQIEVANMKNKDQTTTGQMIDKLEEKQFVERVRSKTDKRAYTLYLTDLGSKVVMDFWNVEKKCEEELLKNLSKEESKMFHKLMDKILK